MVENSTFDLTKMSNIDFSQINFPYPLWLIRPVFLL